MNKNKFVLMNIFIIFLNFTLITKMLKIKKIEIKIFYKIYTVETFISCIKLNFFINNFYSNSISKIIYFRILKCHENRLKLLVIGVC